MRLKLIDAGDHATELLGLATDQSRDRMLAASFGNGRRSQEIGFIEVAAGMHFAQFELAAGQRPGLIEDECVDLGEPFESDRAFDDNARARHPSERRHHRAGRRQNQRAGARDDEHAQRRQEPRRPQSRADPPTNQRQHRDRQHDRQEVPGIPIGRAFERRLLLRRVRNETQYPSQRRLGSDLRRHDLQRPELIDGPREDRIVRTLFDGETLAGQTAFIDRRRALANEAIDRDSLARSHDDDLPDGDLIGGDLGLATIDQNASQRRTQLKRPANRALSPVDRVALDALPADSDEDD